MKYQKAVNVWTLPEESLKRLQVGQWVYPGEKSNKGIWCGITSSGTTVVAWSDNIRQAEDPDLYIRFLINYAKR
jgi:hypothetical protein